MLNDGIISELAWPIKDCVSRAAGTGRETVLGTGIR
jgi:hypothetical protein